MENLRAHENYVGSIGGRNISVPLDLTWQFRLGLDEVVQQTIAEVSKASQVAAVKTLDQLYLPFVQAFMNASGVKNEYAAQRRVLPMHGAAKGTVVFRNTSRRSQSDDLAQIFIGTEPVNALAFRRSGSLSRFRNGTHSLVSSGAYQFREGHPDGLNPYIAENSNYEGQPPRRGLNSLGRDVITETTSGGARVLRRRIHQAVMSRLGRQISRAKGGVRGQLPLSATFERLFHQELSRAGR